ncbi:hypothetical protein ACOSP7_024819 [Xanthoceras sorbifolium]
MIRDFLARVMAAGAIQLAANFSPQMAEAVAIRRGLHFALETGLSLILIESDALGVINSILARSIMCSNLRIVLYHIFHLVSVLDVSSFSFVLRVANKVADVLAKATFGFSSDLFWIESCSPCVELLVQGDFLILFLQYMPIFKQKKYMTK